MNENEQKTEQASTNVEIPKPEPKKARKVMKATPKAEPEVKPRYAPKGTITDASKQKIQLLVKDNPKRPGTKCFTWFSWYRNGMTVKDYYEKGGKADHIRWDVAHGFIALK